ncbi:diguanylate cyclase [Oscillibacter hominis]|uniref:Diguanylate cyclase n=1 Tax=Oscillibacter hominis TaxID=2763056 RepID=A0A7G9B5L5_9FIRM|nr:diguanylate cyclase [Oscillibacter hominis]QNL44846.1 diguanylate cyclase [Oscillibacter hominis]
MQQELSKLKQENERLEQLAHLDWLTGICNRGYTQECVDELLSNRQAGVLLVLDVDRFKQVNDRYGHITGDRLLEEIAAKLRSMVFRTDILGRVGGDEFVIFMPIAQEERFVEERCAQIRDRLRFVELDGQEFQLSVTVAGALAEQGDDYQTLFDRADQILLEKKRARKRFSTLSVQEHKGMSKKGIAIDMERIREELSEQEMIPGAYCQDYETFKSIYRFVERRMRRVNMPVCILLFTLTDGKGEFPDLHQREAQMHVLQESIQNSLRSGDVFTQYTSCQFLVMVSDSDSSQAEGIAERISDVFYRTLDLWSGSLLHHCYPMQPRQGRK